MNRFLPPTLVAIALAAPALLTGRAAATTPVPSPIVFLTKTPAKAAKSATRRARILFRFKADVPEAAFECKMDNAPFTHCKSPQGYRLKQGHHTFQVRATAGGVTGPATKFAFKVKRLKATKGS